MERRVAPRRRSCAASAAVAYGVADLFPTLLQPSRPEALAADFQAVDGAVRASLLAESLRCAYALRHFKMARNQNVRDLGSARLVSVVLAVETGAYGDPAHVTDFKPAMAGVCATKYTNMQRVQKWRGLIVALRDRVVASDHDALRELRAAIVAAGPEIGALMHPSKALRPASFARCLSTRRRFEATVGPSACRPTPARLAP